MEKLYYLGVNETERKELVGYKLEGGYLYGPSGKKLSTNGERVAVTIDGKRKSIKLTEIVPESQFASAEDLQKFEGAPVKGAAELWVNSIKQEATDSEEILSRLGNRYGVTGTPDLSPATEIKVNGVNAPLWGDLAATCNPVRFATGIKEENLADYTPMPDPLELNEGNLGVVKLRDDAASLGYKENKSLDEQVSELAGIPIVPVEAENMTHEYIQYTRLDQVAKTTSPINDSSIWDLSIQDLELLGVANSDLLMDGPIGSFTQFLRTSWYSIEHKEEIGDPRLLASLFAFLVDNSISAVIKTGNVQLMKKLVTMATVYLSSPAHAGQTLTFSFTENEIVLDKLVAQAKKINYPYSADKIRTFAATKLSHEGYSVRARSMNCHNIFITDLSKAELPDVIANSVTARITSTEGVRIYGWDGEYNIPTIIEEMDKYKPMDFRILLDMGPKALAKLAAENTTLILDLTGAEDLINSQEEEFESSLDWYVGHPYAEQAVIAYDALPEDFKNGAIATVIQDMHTDGIPSSLVNEGTKKAYAVRHILKRMIEGPEFTGDQLYRSTEDTAFAMVGALDVDSLDIVLNSKAGLTRYCKILEDIIKHHMPQLSFHEEHGLTNVIIATRVQLGLNK